MKNYKVLIMAKMGNNESFDSYLILRCEKEPTIVDVMIELSKNPFILVAENIAILTSHIMQVALLKFEEQK